MISSFKNCKCPRYGGISTHVIKIAHFPLNLFLSKLANLIVATGIYSDSSKLPAIYKEFAK